MTAALVEANQSYNNTGGGASTGNPNHAPAGSATGGQFTSKGAGSGLGTMPTPSAPRPKANTPAPAGKGTIPPLPTTARTMKVGQTGDDVRNLQYAMGLLGFQVPQHGAYDHATADAVMQAQQRLGLPPNGNASPAFLKKLQDAVRLSPCVKESRAVGLLRRVFEAWNPDLHPRDPDGRFSLAGLIRSLAGAEHKGTERPHGSVGNFTTRGGSRVHVALPSRPMRADDRIQDPTDSKRMGTVAWVHGDTMRVNWDDGSHEVRPVSTTHDPLQEPRRTYQAVPGERAPKLDAGTGKPAPPSTPQRRAADMVAAGRTDRNTAARPLRGESPTSIAHDRTVQGHRERLAAAAGRMGISDAQLRAAGLAATPSEPSRKGAALAERVRAHMVGSQEATPEQVNHAADAVAQLSVPQLRQLMVDLNVSMPKPRGRQPTRQDLEYTLFEEVSGHARRQGYGQVAPALDHLANAAATAREKPVAQSIPRATASRLNAPERQRAALASLIDSARQPGEPGRPAREVLAELEAKGAIRREGDSWVSTGAPAPKSAAAKVAAAKKAAPKRATDLELSAMTPSDVERAVADGRLTNARAIKKLEADNTAIHSSLSTRLSGDVYAQPGTGTVGRTIAGQQDALRQGEELIQRLRLAGPAPRKTAALKAPSAPSSGAAAKVARAKAGADVQGLAAAMRGGGSDQEMVHVLARDPRLTSARLTELAGHLGIDVPPTMRAKSSLQLHIAFEASRKFGPGNGSLASRAPAAPARKDFSGLAAEVRRGGTPDSIREQLTGLNAAELRSLADELNLALPPAAKGAPARRQYIAQTVWEHNRRTRGGI